MTSSTTRNNMRIGRLPAAVASLRLPPSLPPRDIAHMNYMSSPLSPESPADASSGGSLFTPPTTPQDYLPPRPSLYPSQQHNHHLIAQHQHLAYPSPAHQQPSRSATAAGNAGASAGVALSPPPLPAFGSGSAAGAGADPGILASENKRAQNRRSAKRFREAQKIRWKALQEENTALRGELDRVTTLLARSGIVDDAAPARPDARAAAISISALVAQPRPATVCSAPAPTVDPSPGSASNGASTGGGHPPPYQNSQPQHQHPYPPSPADPGIAAESEAALYAQVLGCASPVRRNSPYAAELGVFLRAICARSGTVLRGEPLVGDTKHAGPLALTAGLSPGHVSALTRALGSSVPVALAYVRSGVTVNVVVGPGEDGGPGVVAEFSPFDKAQ